MNQASMLQPIATLTQALTALVIGFGVIYYASLQWKVARDKLRLDLFDRRYKVFEAVRKFIASAVNKPEFDCRDLLDFDIGTSDTEFLFGPEVGEYLKEVRSRALKMEEHRKMYQPLPTGEIRSRGVDEETAERAWLIKQLLEMTKIFAPYLNYSNIKRDSTHPHMRAFRRWRSIH